MGTVLLPSCMNMIPTLMIMDMLGWTDQARALYLPGAASAFGIVLMPPVGVLIDSQRSGGSRPHGRLQRVGHLLAHRAAAAQARAGHAGADRLHRQLEQLFLGR